MVGRFTAPAQGDNPVVFQRKPKFPIKALSGACWKILALGTAPVSLVYNKSMELILSMLEREAGILPNKLLCERLRFSNLVSFAKVEGIEPARELWLRSRSNCSVDNFPTSDGMCYLTDCCCSSLSLVNSQNALARQVCYHSTCSPTNQDN